MNITEPQFLYMIPILPALFGITLIGEGIVKVIHEEWLGIMNIVFGLMFIVVVAFAYFMFQSYAQGKSLT